MNYNILLVEDDLKLNDLIKNYFTIYNYRVFQAEDNIEAEKILAKEKINLIILDIMLPKMNGFEFCKKIRKTSDIPILFLSARGEVTDKIVGLEIGADDYMSKPFEPRELLTRVGAILRRTKISPISKKEEVMGAIKINWDLKKVYLNQNPLQLTYLEFELLALFFKNKGKILDRDFILKKLHNLEWDGYNRSVDVLVGRLRQKIQDNKKNPIIKSAWGRGYGIE